MLLFVSGLIAGASFIVAELGRNADPFMPHLHAAPAGKEPDRGADHGRSRRPEGCRREARHSTEHSGGRRAWSRSRRGIRRRVRRFDASNPQCDPGRRRMERDGPGNARAWSWLRLFGHGPSIERQSGACPHGPAPARRPLVELSRSRARCRRPPPGQPRPLSLGRCAAARQEAYRALLRAALEEGFVDGLRAATQGGWALGDARFKRRIAKALGRRAVAAGTPSQGEAGSTPAKSTLTQFLP